MDMSVHVSRYESIWNVLFYKVNNAEKHLYIHTKKEFMVQMQVLYI